MSVAIFFASVAGFKPSVAVFFVSVAGFKLPVAVFFASVADFDYTIPAFLIQISGIEHSIEIFFSSAQGIDSTVINSVREKARKQTQSIRNLYSGINWKSTDTNPDIYFPSFEIIVNFQSF